MNDGVDLKERAVIRPGMTRHDWTRTRGIALRLIGVVALFAAAAFAASPSVSVGAPSSQRPIVLATPGVSGSRSTIRTADASETPNATSTPDASATPSAAPTRTLGHSVQGRPIVLETFGSGSRHILFVGGIHGNEFGGPVTRKFAAYLRAHPSVIPSGTEVDVIAYANPDGTAHNKRANAHNVDINRNFPSKNWNRTRNASGASPGKKPGSEPETRALLGVLASGHYVRVISMHSSGGILDYDGPGGWSLAKRMSKASRVPLHRLAVYHGSMGSYIPEVYRTPIVTWELSSRALTSRVRAGMLAALK